MRQERIGFLLMRDFTHLAFSCALEPLRIANFVSGAPLYDWVLLSGDGAAVECSNGAVTQVAGTMDGAGRLDRLFVISGLNVPDHTSADILAQLRRARAHGVRIGAICSGAYVLAKAGLLDGREAAMHWAWHDRMAAEFPKLTLRRSVFVIGDRFDTASGGTASADMILHLIARAHGRELALEVSDQMLYNAVRDSRAEQRLSPQSRYGIRSKHLTRALRIIEDNVQQPLSPSAIAQELGVSVRQLERLFNKYLGTSPSRFIMDQRLMRAQALLQQTDQTVVEIALSCGFSSAAHFAKVYGARYGMSPGKHRAVSV